MQKITPHLWFDKEAREAAEFYVSLFPNSEIKSTQTLHDTPSGDAVIVSFELDSYPFMAISAGPLFKFNPSVSFTVALKTKEEIDTLWNKLLPKGEVLMPLQTYPFSEKYGWLKDKYGLSWQIVLDDEHYAYKHLITPSLLFVGDVYGQSEEAFNFYTSVFPDSALGGMAKYPAGMAPEKEGAVMHGAATLANQEFFFMDSAREHNFKFNEAISFMVNCEDQKELDYYWEKLSAVPEAEQCGWLKDKYGLSWQIVPTALGKIMSESTPEEMQRVTQAFLKMKKFDIAELERARLGQ